MNPTKDLTNGKNGVIAVLAKNAINVLATLSFLLLSFTGGVLWNDVRAIADGMNIISVKLGKMEETQKFLLKRQGELGTEKDPLYNKVANNSENIEKLEKCNEKTNEKIYRIQTQINKFH